MIPKIIHYCWVGGKKTRIVEACITSWKKFCPDWEIKEWNDDNIPLDLFAPLAQAYKHKRYAIVSDFIRLYSTYNMGGIYLDSDVELIKNLDVFLKEKCFFSFQLPSDRLDAVNDAVMGAQQYHPFVKEMILEYLLRVDGVTFHKAGPWLITSMLRRMGLREDEPEDAQTLRMGDIAIFPKRYFHPHKWNEKFTPECVKPDTYGIHHFQVQWVSE